MKDIELWKDIKGFEGLYQASTHGNIRSVDRIITQVGHKNNYKRKMRGKIIKPKLQNNGYYVVWLSKDGIVKPYTVHRIIDMELLMVEGCENNSMEVSPSNIAK